MKMTLYRWIKYSDHFVVITELNNHVIYFDCEFNDCLKRITEITITKDIPKEFFIKYLRKINERNYLKLVKQFNELIPALDFKKDKYDFNDLCIAYNNYYGFQL